jgi:tetratricopeptide (TPR) repeat protein
LEEVSGRDGDSMKGFALLALAAGCAAAAPHYAGTKACSSCHAGIAKTQAQTAMANSWHGALPKFFPSNFAAATTEGPDPKLSYEVRRIGAALRFSTTTADGSKLDLPVESVIGGKRHGLSFLERVQEVGGVALERPALVEGRFAFNIAHQKLLLSPGFDPEKPANYEDSLGRTLSPAFEQRCLTCHGEPNTLGAGLEGGVRCETCHGPAAEHAQSLQSKPPSLKGEQQLEVCGQCHTGLADRSDAVPDDLLVSNQVPALKHSECFRQSGHNVICTDCHDPHQDSAHVAERTVGTCLQCHSGAGAAAAATCPVNGKTGCIGCHMPAIEKDTFLMTDHWIRVHPEQNVHAQSRDNALRTHVLAKHEYLRLIVVENRQAAAAALERVQNGEAFAQVAHQVSADPSAPGGGYIGDMELSQMDPKLASAAAQLGPGESSPVVELSDRFVILYRMPRDFRWQADQLYQDAVALKSKGDLKGAAAKDQQALDVYPYFLRALVLMGTTLGEAGDRERAGAVLQFAAQSYPKDPSAQFDYALTLGNQPQQQIEAFQHALELNPDMTAGYESLGAAQFAAGQPQAAIATFRQGLQVDPLSASLYYNLSLALRHEGDSAGADRAFALARKLDPKTGK